LDAVVHGRRCSLLQFSAVGTLPEWRRRGLNRHLTELALRWAQGKQNGVLLFSSDEAIPYYLSMEFRPLREYIEVLPVTPAAARGGLHHSSPPPNPGAVRLDLRDPAELHRIHRRAQRRAPLSETLSILNPHLLIFHLLHGLGECAYEIPDLRCMVLLSRSGERLRITARA
jgi:hypothetical protein